MHASQIGNCDLINREPAHQRPPLGAHVGDGKTGIHRKAGHAGPAELDGSVQNLIVVIQTAEGDDDIFPSCSFRQFAFEHNLDGSRNLPPEIAGCPNGGSIGAHDRRTHCTESAVHVGVRIGGDHKRARHHVPAFHHDLVANAGTGGIKIHPVLLGERLNRAVLLLIRLILILNIVVERKHELLRIMNFLRPDPLKLAHDRRSVVMCHDIARVNGDEISRTERPLRPFR